MPLIPIVFLLAGVVGVGYPSAQTAPPAKPKTVEKKTTATKEAGEQAEAAEATLQLEDLPPAVRTTVTARR